MAVGGRGWPWDAGGQGPRRPAVGVPAAPPPRSCRPPAHPGRPEGTGGDGVAQPAPPGLPHVHPAPRNRVRRRPRPAPGWAARSGGMSPAGLAERVPAGAEGDGDRDGDRDSLASSSVGAGRSRLVYQDGGAIPPARSASRGSGAERKADVTPCFWVQTIGIQERGAARLREPAAPSSSRPAIAPFSPGPPRSTAPWGGPGSGHRPGCTLTSPGLSPAGGQRVGGVALPTHGGSAPP